MYIRIYRCIYIHMCVHTGRAMHCVAGQISHCHLDARERKPERDDEKSELHHRIISWNHSMGLYYGIISQNKTKALYYGIVVRNFIFPGEKGACP